MEYSIEELVQIVQDGEHVLDSMEVDPFIVERNDDDYKVVEQTICWRCMAQIFWLAMGE